MSNCIQRNLVPQDAKNVHLLLNKSAELSESQNCLKRRVGASFVAMLAAIGSFSNSVLYGLGMPVNFLSRVIKLEFKNAFLGLGSDAENGVCSLVATAIIAAAVFIGIFFPKVHAKIRPVAVKTAQNIFPQGIGTFEPKSAKSEISEVVQQCYNDLKNRGNSNICELEALINKLDQEFQQRNEKLKRLENELAEFENNQIEQRKEADIKFEQLIKEKQNYEEALAEANKKISCFINFLDAQQVKLGSQFIKYLNSKQLDTSELNKDEEISNLNSRMKQLKAKNLDLQSENKNLTNENDALKEENQQLKRYNEELGKLDKPGK